MTAKDSVDRSGLGVSELPSTAPPQLERSASQNNGTRTPESSRQYEKPVADSEDVESGGASGNREYDERGDNDGPETHNAIFSKIGVFTHSKYAVYLRDAILLTLLLGWWIVAIINDRPEIRIRWIPSTIIAWFFILLILLHNSRYIPQRPILRVIYGTWNTLLGKPWSKMPYRARLGLGWACLAVLFFGSTYGLPEVEASTRVQRTISLAGYVLIYLGFFTFSSNHKAIKARTTILGMGLQFAIALFVFRTDAGFSLFKWIALAAADLLAQAQAPTDAYSIGGGAGFFWSADFVNENHFFFVNTLASIIFFVALCIAFFYLGVLQWVIRKLSTAVFVTFGISGGEAVVAVASPFIGQGENCVLVRPFVKTFTRSEFHQVLVSGFSAIAGSVFSAYVLIGVSGKDLICASIQSIPAAIAASKLVYPETEESDTAGRVTIAREEDEEDKASNFFEALSNGASFGLKVALLIFCNVLVLVSLVTTINGILAWIGRALYITDANGPLTLQLIFGYVLWPLTFMLGVPKTDVLQVSQLIALKFIANEFVAYTQLQKVIMPGPTPLSPRGYLIAKYALCSFSNVASVSISVGVLTALAPKRKKDIIKLSPSALLTGFFVTLSSAAIAGIVADPNQASS
ncbi:unnamed protein product [Jaminaea pallidilutea]